MTTISPLRPESGGREPRDDDGSEAWRPGMAGEARVNVEHRRLIWIWTHRVVDWLQLKLWM